LEISCLRLSGRLPNPNRNRRIWQSGGSLKKLGFFLNILIKILKIKELKKKLQTPVIFGILIAALAGFIIIGVRAAGGFQFLELAMYDFYIRFQPQLSKTDPRILLITLSETDIKKQGTHPIPDGILAKLLETVLSQKPRVIALDMYRDIPVNPGSEHLVKIFSEYQNIITVKKLGNKNTPGINQPYMVKDNSLVSSNDILVDSEGVVRRGLLFLDDGKEAYHSFALMVALNYLKAEGIAPKSDPFNPEFLRLGNTTFVPLEKNDGGYIRMDARGYQFLLDFSGAKNSFSSISISDILSGEFKPQNIKDKIVIIGSTAESLKDFFFIPFQRSGDLGQVISGVELHAVIVSQLIGIAMNNRKLMRFMKEPYEWLWIMVWSFSGYLMGLSLHSFPRFVLSNIAGFAAWILITFILFKNSLWVPVIPPAVAGLLSSILVTAYLSYQEKTQRAILMQLFCSHVSKDVAESLWEQRDQFIKDGRPSPRKVTATVLFTDLRGFTSISEKMDAEVLMEWLNEYMGAMVKIVRNHNGIVNKFIGDSIMAVFGVPILRESEKEINQDAVNAVRCAIEMGKELESLNALWSAQNRPTTTMRVGIYTGTLVVGSLGSSQRQEYTVIGDTVNVASRLEGFDKNFDADNICRILIGESTLQRLGNQFHTEKLTSVSLKGKDQKIIVYKVLPFE